MNANEHISNIEIDDICTITVEQSKYNEDLNRTVIGNQETEMPIINKISYMTTFPFLCYLHLWSKILPEIDKTQKYLQTNSLGLDQSVIAINALASFFQQK